MAIQNSLNLTTTGMVSANGSGTFTGRTITTTGSTGISVSNGSGVSGAPTIDGITATSSVLGVASFPAADFVVTAGAVALEAGRRQTSASYSNLGFTYSGSTFTVCGFDGTALSATNPAYVYLQKNTTPGELLQFTITANQTFVDSTGSSTIIGNLFGLTDAVAYTNDVPFFLYACASGFDNTTIKFGISRMPSLSVAPAASAIGTPSSAIADVQRSLFLFSNVTVADYAAAPVLLVGSFRMRMNASDDWAVQAFTLYDGIGQFQENVTYTVPTGTFGAASGGLLYTNGGTAPAWTTNNMTYTITKAGSVNVRFHLESDAGTDGSGAVQAKLALPYSTSLAAASAYTAGAGITFYAGGTTYVVTPYLDTDNNWTIFQKYPAGNGADLLLSDYANGNRLLAGSLTYKIG